ncbi:hypothetical protein Patl1_22089 [Pistacia atlantica]|uniref:Uncharacterized protein n=1 Tax=Pistacia atlantica TaxID=434234 RepID=A0ACC1BL89_9ROSI|nr:hypothetical protein Patl1_22089 [Pistacia atlantica]
MARKGDILSSLNPPSSTIVASTSKPPHPPTKSLHLVIFTKACKFKRQSNMETTSRPDRWSGNQFLVTKTPLTFYTLKL